MFTLQGEKHASWQILHNELVARLQYQAANLVLHLANVKVDYAELKLSFKSVTNLNEIKCCKLY